MNILMIVSRRVGPSGENCVILMASILQAEVGFHNRVFISERTAQKKLFKKHFKIVKYAVRFEKR